MTGKLEVRLLGPFEVVVAGRAGGRPGRQAAGARGVPGLAHRVASSRRTRWSRRCGAAIFPQRLETPCSTMWPGCAERWATTRSGSPPTGTRSTGGVVDATEFEELLTGCARGAPRRRCAWSRGHDRRRARALARAGPARPASVLVGDGRGRATGLAAARRVGGALRGGARAGRARRRRCGDPRCARRKPVPRAPVGTADAGAVSERTPGGRARRVPGGPPACSWSSWHSSRDRNYAVSRRRSSRTTLRSRPCPRPRCGAATCRRPRPRSSAARRSSRRWSSSYGSIAS